MSPLKGKTLFMFDLEGVLYAGKDSPRLIGGIEVLRRLRSEGRRYFILTNTSTHTRMQIASKLSSVGFKVDVEEVLTAARLTAEFLRNRFGEVECYLIGEDGFREELEACGHKVVSSGARFVVVGLDRSLTYRKLDMAMQLLRSGAKLIASHKASVYMEDGGPALAVGPFVKALEYASRVRALTIGKPSPHMYRLAMRKGQTDPLHTVMAGDQLETDIYGAKKLGIYTVLTLSGVETEETLASSRIKPDLVVENVDELLPLL